MHETEQKTITKLFNYTSLVKYFCFLFFLILSLIFSSIFSLNPLLAKENITIRSADVNNNNDTRTILEILRSTGWFPYLNAEDAEVHLRVRLQKAQKNGSTILVAVQSEVGTEGSTTSNRGSAPEGSGKVLGFISTHWNDYLFLRGQEGLISELFVHPDATGQRIGQRLLHAIEEIAGSRGCSRLQLNNGKTWTSYKRRFYAKQGFRERTESANFMKNLTPD